jgi:hypothetical protein
LDVSVSPQRFIFVLIVFVVVLSLVIVGIDVAATRAGPNLVVIIVVIAIHRRDGLRRVLV